PPRTISTWGWISTGPSSTTSGSRSRSGCPASTWRRRRRWARRSRAGSRAAARTSSTSASTRRSSSVANRLAGKVAIVTGAGSRGPGLGNGKATAILFAREGARVLCVDLAKERAEETLGLIRGEGGEAEAFAADVTVAAQCRAMVDAALQRWGGLDVLHNNVGIESRHTLLTTTEEEWDHVMAVDLKSMLLTC